MALFSSHTFRTVSMPLGMLIGALFCREMAWAECVTNGWLTPMFIASMLFITFCRVDARKIHFSWLHLWLLAIQVVGSFAIYYALSWADVVVAQGGMICVLAPVAMGAVVIGGMLGANLESMAAYSLLCNIFIAFFAPYMLHTYGNGLCTMLQILQRVTPMLIAPFLAGQLCRWLTPKFSGWIAGYSQISFYIWLMSLIVIIGRTTCFIIDNGENRKVQMALAAVALVICLCQFMLGRYLGRRYGDAASGGQSLGQKNTVLAVWMSQSFLDPVSCVAPTAYIVWQNIVNSYQLYLKGKADKEIQNSKFKIQN